MYVKKPAPVDLSNNTPATEENAVERISADGTYRINPASSTVRWQGSRPLISGYFDNGVISIQNGTFQVANGVVTSGTFTIDMKTISVVSSGKGSDESRLATHLKSADFFDAEKFPTSTFTIKSVTADGQVSGDLTVKGITKPITFQANITETNGILGATATIELDRTLWNVQYGSDKFFDNLGEKMISDMFTVQLDLKAEKAN